MPREVRPFFGRGERIRTSDLFNPIEARYQAALRPVRGDVDAPIRGLVFAVVMWLETAPDWAIKTPTGIGPMGVQGERGRMITSPADAKPIGLGQPTGMFTHPAWAISYMSVARDS